MLLPTSSEFVALCRAQLSLLSQKFGASLSVVYLTQQLVEGADAHLVPIVARPESAMDWASQGSTILPFTAIAATPPRLLQDDTAAALEVAGDRCLLLPAPSAARDVSASQYAPEYAADVPEPAALIPQRQVILPLMHEDVVLGLLVVGRDDRGWTAWERNQIEPVAATIALACVLDQQARWLEQERQQEQLLQAQQHDRLDNLLHQFRNSVTALQTFGKLMLKRLVPGDANRSIVESIVRETLRLKELSQQLEVVSDSPADSEMPATSVHSPLFLPPARSETIAAAPLSESELTGGALTGSAMPLMACIVADVLDPLIASALPIAQDRDLTLQTRLPANLPRVQANPQALREVCNNLIENALKYTSAGGLVLVEAFLIVDATAWVEIAISDTGSGIPATDQPHIFERRYRGVQSQTEIPGSGLGLAIAKTLVEQMQGQLEFTSPADSQQLAALRSLNAKHPGTTFRVRLAVWRE